MIKAEQITHEDRELLKAVAAKDIEALDSAINSGANPDIIDERGLTPLLSLLFEPFSDTIRNLCIQLLLKKADPNLTTAHGISPLHKAVEIDDVGLVQMLCHAKANPNLARIDTGETPYTLAIKGNRTKLIPILKQHGGKLPKANPLQQHRQPPPKPVLAPRKEEDNQRFKPSIQYQYRGLLNGLRNCINPTNKNHKKEIKKFWQEIGQCMREGGFNTVKLEGDLNCVLAKAIVLMEHFVLNIDLGSVQKLDGLLGHDAVMVWNHDKSVGHENIFRQILRPTEFDDKPKFTPKRYNRAKNEAALKQILSLAETRWSETKEVIIPSAPPLEMLK